MHKPTKAEVMREARDYIFITLGLFSMLSVGLLF